MLRNNLDIPRDQVDTMLAPIEIDDFDMVIKQAKPTGEDISP